MSKKFCGGTTIRETKRICAKLGLTTSGHRMRSLKKIGNRRVRRDRSWMV